MAQAGPKIARRSLFGALLTTPMVGATSSLAGQRQRPGFIWIEVPEQPWYDFLAAARRLAER